jgi:RNA polymerase sigma-70 factor (ECF subfamily)
LDDAAALDHLVLEHLSAALRFATRLVGNPDVAEEIVQESLARVVRAWPGFRQEARFRTWLFRIILNVFQDHLRKPAPATQIEASDEQIIDPSTPNPAITAMAVELGEIVARQISTLPPRQREVLVLRVYEQLNVKEVAGLLGISEANVHSTLHVARERLREKLSPYFTDH